MADAPLPLPFEFTVTGEPYSHQSHNRAALAAWRRAVTTAAARYWTAMPLAGVRLRIAVTYLHEGREVRIDGDNLLKPIQDALIGLIYDDDRLIVDAHTRKTPIDDPMRPRRASRVLLAGYATGMPFVHVRIDYAPPPDAPLRDQP